MSDSDLERDLEFSRQTYLALIQAGQLAIEDMAEVAKATEHPRSFEVLGGMIKSISDVTDRLLASHKTHAEIKQKSIIPDNQQPLLGSGPVTNHVYVGSTTDLQRMLIAQQKEVIDAEAVDVTPSEDG